jgi:hypothetical protein
MAKNDGHSASPALAVDLDVSTVLFTDGDVIHWRIPSWREALKTYLEDTTTWLEDIT